MGNEKGGIGRYEKGQEIFMDYVIRQYIDEGQYAWVYKVENPVRVRALAWMCLRTLSVNR